MNCHDFRMRLAALVETKESSPDVWSRFEQHAEACSDPGCRQLWADEQLLSAVIPYWTESIPHVSLAERVLVQMRQTHPAERDRQPVRLSGEAAAVPVGSWSSTDRPARRWLGLTAAAAVLLLIVSLIRVSDGPPVGIAFRGPSQTESLAAPQAGPAMYAAPREEIPDVVRTYVSVPQTATQFVTDTVVLFLPADAAAHGDEPPSRPALWRGRLSEQLEPWGRELGTAFDAILESVTDTPKSSHRDSPSRLDRSETA